MERVLITGADGFTGRYLALTLAAAGFEVHGLVPRPIAGTAPGGVHHWHVCDLLDRDGLARIVADVVPTRVAHLAAIAFVQHGDVDAIYRTNIVGTRHLLEALAGNPHRPETVLLASSANVYGNASAGLVNESVPAAPANDYAVSKLAMEAMAALWRDRLPLIVARPFNYTGVGQSDQFLLPKIVSHFKKRLPVIELGNLDVERDFSDVRMVVDVYRRLLDKPSLAGGTFNVCSGQGHSLSEVLAICAELSSHRLEVRVNPAFVRANEVRRLVGDRALLERCIGPLNLIDLRTTLAWMLA